MTKKYRKVVEQYHRINDHKVLGITITETDDDKSTIEISQLWSDKVIPHTSGDKKFLWKFDSRIFVGMTIEEFSIVLNKGIEYITSKHEQESSNSRKVEREE